MTDDREFRRQFFQALAGDARWLAEIVRELVLEQTARQKPAADG